MANRSREAVEPPAGSTTEPDFELTDEQWNLISDLFPEPPPRPKGGRPTVPARRCVEGLLWLLRSGARWKDLPKHFPSPATCWRRHDEWTKEGIWETAWARLLRVLDREGRIKHEESIADGTFSPAKKGVKRWARPNAAKAPRSWCLLTAKACLGESTQPAPALMKSR